MPETDDENLRETASAFADAITFWVTILAVIVGSFIMACSGRLLLLTMEGLGFIKQK